MPPPKLPESQRIAFEKIAALGDAKIGEIAEVLRRKSIVSGAQEISAEIRVLAPELPPEDLARISETLEFFYSVRASADFSAEKLASDVARVFRNQATVEFSETDFARFKKNLATLFGINSLEINAKASALRLDFENVFCDAKVLTDVRTVFGSNVDEQPVGFILAHTLKLEYHDDAGRHREFYVMLNEEEIAALQGVLDRAERKGKSLTAFMERSGLRYLPAE